MPANSNPGSQWTVPATENAPRILVSEDDLDHWNSAGEFVVPRRQIATPRVSGGRLKSEVRHIRGIEMARGKHEMIRSRTFSDLYRHRLLNKSSSSTAVIEPKVLSKPSQFPPITGYSLPGSTNSRLPYVRSDENLRSSISRENSSTVLPLRHVGSSNSLTSYGSGLASRPEITRPKRNSSPAIVTLQKERRVSFVFDRSSSGSIASGNSGIKMTARTDKNLRPISVMTNCSSPLSSVLEINFPVKTDEDEKRIIESFRPHTARTDTANNIRKDTYTNKITNHASVNGVLKNRPINVRDTFRDRDKWSRNVERSYPKLGFTLHRSERQVVPKIARRVSYPANTTAMHFESISDCDNPANKHKTVSLIYNEDTGKSEMVTETPRTLTDLQMQLNHVNDSSEDEGNNEHVSPVTRCAPLTRENVKTRDESAVSVDKRQHILNWLCGDRLWSTSDEDSGSNSDSDDVDDVDDEQDE
ncbi:uncharacterized protein LOC144341983 [Saccoglossus kowalevskii]